MSKLAIFRDFRGWCLLLALPVLLAAFLYPHRPSPRPVYRFTVIVDITRSMNVEDYRLDGKPVSRLAYVRHALRELLLALPCQSQLALGVFTERRSALLYTPIEVCTGFNELDKSIAALDWRMAWAADSRIAAGLLQTLQAVADTDTHLLFLTDGQEAPPLNPRYRPDFSGLKGKVAGLIVGVGGLQPAPIPRFDNNGRRQGVYGPADVPQRSSFGESELNPEQIPGYDARNAPFGSAAAVGSEHLGAVHEDYLQQLAAESGLGYQRLLDAEQLRQAVQTPAYARQQTVPADIRLYYALALLMLLLLQLA